MFAGRIDARFADNTIFYGYVVEAGDIDAMTKCTNRGVVDEVVCAVECDVGSINGETCPCAAHTVE